MVPVFASQEATAFANALVFIGVVYTVVKFGRAFWRDYSVRLGSYFRKNQHTYVVNRIKELRNKSKRPKEIFLDLQKGILSSIIECLLSAFLTCTITIYYGNYRLSELEIEYGAKSLQKLGIYSENIALMMVLCSLIFTFWTFICLLSGRFYISEAKKALNFEDERRVLILKYLDLRGRRE